MNKNVKLTRPQTLAKNIAIVDGFSRSGKSLMMPILSHLENAELWQVSVESEYLCRLDYLNKIDYESAKTLIKSNFDNRLYELSLARNINLRESDPSSVQNNLLMDKYQKRILDIREKDPIVDRIKKEKSLLVMNAHYIFGISDLYFRSFGDSLDIYIFMLRNPSHLINEYFKYNFVNRIGKESMEGQLCIEISNNIYPYYAVEYYKEYLEANDLEKNILVICKYLKKVFDRYRLLSDIDKKKFYFISFEQFASNPDIFMNDICNTMNRGLSATYKKMLKHLNMPRDEEKIDYEQTYKLAQENNIKIGEKYKDMLEEAIEQYKLFIDKGII